jgi:hypothetical protein
MISLSIISLLTMIIGIIMMIFALRNKAPGSPKLPLRHAREWRWWWNQKAWFTPKGYKYNILGTIFVCGGALMGFIYWVAK